MCSVLQDYLHTYNLEGYDQTLLIVYNLRLTANQLEIWCTTISNILHPHTYFRL